MRFGHFTTLVIALVIAGTLAGCSDGSDNIRTLPTAGPDYISPAEIGPNTESDTFPEGEGGEAGEGGEGGEGHSN